MGAEKAHKEMLSLRNITVGYTGQPLLFSNLNVSLKEGELVCFMGPNGAGKSTLIRTIAGLQRPLAGEISYSSAAVDSENLNRKIALVLTDPVKGLNMTVAEIVTFGRYPHLNWSIRLDKKDLDIIDSAIERVNIGGLRDVKLSRLSDGQLQMVMIARAIAQDTPVIILDEPTAHLDLNNRVEIMRLLHGLANESGKTILLATHELDLALQTADLIWLTGNSQNIVTGIPEDLVLNGSFDETFKFKGFDLKTGKVEHKPFKNMNIQLSGSDYFFLWTKNALERNGYSIVASHAEHTIDITKDPAQASWTLDQAKTFGSLAELIEALQGPSI